MKFQSNLVRLTILTVLALSVTRITAEPDASNVSAENDETTDLGKNARRDKGKSLEEMTIEELEEICTNRGFDVVKGTDDETGETKTYSHEDYVMAAQQCLDIEAEMEELLAKNPGLIDEIDAEAEKMRLENERLEQEIADLIRENSDNEEVQKLKNEKDRLDGDMDNLNRILDATATRASNSTVDEADSEDIKTNDNGISGATNEGIDKESIEPAHEATIIVEEDEVTHTEENSEEVLDLDDDAEVKEKNIDQMNADPIENKPEKEETKERDDSSLSNTPEEPLTIATFVDEIRAQVVADFRSLLNVLDIILPKSKRNEIVEAVKPLILILRNAASTVMDMVKRYIPQLFGQGNTDNDSNSNAVAATS